MFYAPLARPLHKTNEIVTRENENKHPKHAFEHFHRLPFDPMMLDDGELSQRKAELIKNSRKPPQNLSLSRLAEAWAGPSRRENQTTYRPALCVGRRRRNALISAVFRSPKTCVFLLPVRSGLSHAYYALMPGKIPEKIKSRGTVPPYRRRWSVSRSYKQLGIAEPSSECRKKKKRFTVFGHGLPWSTAAAVVKLGVEIFPPIKLGKGRRFAYFDGLAREIKMPPREDTASRKNWVG